MKKLNGVMIEYEVWEDELIEVTFVTTDHLAVLHWVYYIAEEKDLKNEKWGESHEFHSSATGVTSLSSFAYMLADQLNRFKFLYAVGAEKCGFLQSLLENKRKVFDLESFGYAPWASYYANKDNACSVHLETEHAAGCSKLKVKQLRLFYNTSQHALNLYNTESRLATFSKWTSLEMSAAVLANVGFVHTPRKVKGTDDTTTCIYCNLTLWDWRRKDDPIEEHRRFNSKCAIFINI